jgi:hypothetical protein
MEDHPGAVEAGGWSLACSPLRDFMLNLGPWRLTLHGAKEVQSGPVEVYLLAVEPHPGAL